MSFSGRCIQLEVIIRSKLSQYRGGQMFSLICGSLYYIDIQSHVCLYDMKLNVKLPRTEGTNERQCDCIMPKTQTNI